MINELTFREEGKARQIHYIVYEGVPPVEKWKSERRGLVIDSLWVMARYGCKCRSSTADKFGESSLLGNDRMRL